ncbi:ATP phosphoribosyltransferase [Streptoalloteichus hindustanus]|uniref:ATP phosphoribosyltransferase n=1 Tax=Streptoalloteichus hindustanus TaxID=2017 RepID=A0A1M5FEP8_STRHI|nr:ATP phosphoribosyltransferase [Streptoalloteichus hindustanus]SHF90004.1 ATP phosphoribosyltransferase (homohexameric) [Streptoalloteichus hindustanus]
MLSRMTLRIAVPNKGSLSAKAIELLVDAGYRANRGDRELRVTDTDNDIRFFFQRPKDIATYVGSGDLEVGITGLDLLVNSAAPAEPVLDLGFAKSEFRFAAPPGGVSGIEELQGRRVATSFPVLVEKHLADHGVKVELIRLDGAVENAIELGVADAIADVVETGESLRTAGLVPFGEPLMRSQAILIRSTRRAYTDEQTAAIKALTNRLRGVLDSRLYAIMDYNCPRAVVQQACALTPGVESPTISAMADWDWVAVRSLVRRDEAQRIMDELEGIGAKAILMTALEGCRVTPHR